jgi:hypothetical protein
MAVSASPIYIFSPGRVIEYRARNVMIHVRKSVSRGSRLILEKYDSVMITK